MKNFFKIRQAARDEYIEEVLGTLHKFKLDNFKQNWSTEEVVLLLDETNQKIMKQEKT